MWVKLRCKHSYTPRSFCASLQLKQIRLSHVATGTMCGIFTYNYLEHMKKSTKCDINIPYMDPMGMSPFLERCQVARDDVYVHGIFLLNEERLKRTPESSKSQGR